MADQKLAVTAVPFMLSPLTWCLRSFGLSAIAARRRRRLLREKLLLEAQNEAIKANSLLKLARRLLAGFCDAVVELDGQFAITSEDPNLRAMLTAASPLVGRTFIELVKEDERDALTSSLLSADEHGPTPLCMHSHLRGSFSSFIPVRLFFAKSVAETGDTQYLIGVLEDADDAELLQGVASGASGAAEAAPDAQSEAGAPSEAPSDADSIPSDWKRASAVEFRWASPDRSAAAGKLRFSHLKRQSESAGPDQTQLLSANKTALEWLGIQDEEKLRGCDLEDFVSAFDFGTLQRLMQRTAKRSEEWQCWQLGPLNLQNPFDLTGVDVSMPWLMLEFVKDEITVHMYPLPGRGSTNLQSMRLLGSTWNLCASCAAQPPFKVLRPNFHMKSVASDALLQQAEEEGLRRFFSPASADAVEAWVAEKLQGAIEVDCVLGVVFAQWDLQPQTVWLRLIWPEPAFKEREEFLLSFLNSLEPAALDQTPDQPTPLLSALPAPKPGSSTTMTGRRQVALGDGARPPSPRPSQIVALGEYSAPPSPKIPGARGNGVAPQLVGAAGASGASERSLRAGNGVGTGTPSGASELSVVFL